MFIFAKVWNSNPTHFSNLLLVSFTEAETCVPVRVVNDLVVPLSRFYSGTQFHCWRRLWVAVSESILGTRVMVPSSGRAGGMCFQAICQGKLVDLCSSFRDPGGAPVM